MIILINIFILDLLLDWIHDLWHLVLNFDLDKNVNIFGVDNSSSMHTDNRKEEILVFGEGLPQGLCNTTITEEAKYSINFTLGQRKCVA